MPTPNGETNPETAPEKPSDPLVEGTEDTASGQPAQKLANPPAGGSPETPEDEPAAASTGKPTGKPAEKPTRKPAGKPAESKAASPSVRIGQVVVRTELSQTVPSPVVPLADVGAVQTRRVRTLIALGAAAVLLVAAAVLCWVGWNSTRKAANDAFVNGGATAEVVGQVTKAMVTAYSYDYTKLPDDIAAAKSVATGQFAREQPEKLKERTSGAQAQQAVLHTQVPSAGVILLRGDRARLLMMVDQAATVGPNKQPLTTSTSVVVDAQKVDGRWKIAQVTPE